MTPVELSNIIYHDEDAARAHLEAVRWPDGPICPHCGVIKEGIRPLLGTHGAWLVLLHVLQRQVHG